MIRLYLTAILALTLCGGPTMLMPGQSFRGPLPH